VFLDGLFFLEAKVFCYFAIAIAIAIAIPAVRFNLSR
jgi:hypothetical protein